ncbi:MAG: fibrobacter succinogenes major paralogous domain-containing protein [Bacteroidales bacterium]|jgi:uncharacterized protein (TIGR02145 family)|nr:fibrobacter succinogenes major paralogous domain-containing protein [Bacteroidales bacterium]
MKKTISTIFAIALSFGIFAQQNDTMFVHSKQFIHEFATQEVDSIIFYRTQGKMLIPCDTVFRVDTIIQIDTILRIDILCDTITITSWTSSLGNTSFVTDSIRIISNGVMIQVWSDAVTATGCSKTDFNGYSGNFNVDCRSNPNQKGDLFSWLAISELKDELCPVPWRVPTRQDFIDLYDLVRGLASSSTHTSQVIFATDFRNAYLNNWGGTYGGSCSSVGTLSGQGSSASYWSQSEFNSAEAYSFGFNSTALIIASNSRTRKDIGCALRCVR